MQVSILERKKNNKKFTFRLGKKTNRQSTSKEEIGHDREGKTQTCMLKLSPRRKGLKIRENWRCCYSHRRYIFFGSSYIYFTTFLLFRLFWPLDHPRWRHVCGRANIFFLFFFQAHSIPFHSVHALTGVCILAGRENCQKRSKREQDSASWEVTLWRKVTPYFESGIQD